MNSLAPFAITLCALTSGCTALDHDPMQFTAKDTQIIAAGEIDAGTLERFTEIATDNPEAKTLILRYVGGSVDDDANLAFSTQLRARGFTTVVPANGLVASGGTDLFLAGTTRILEPGACIGVHSWSGGGVEGKDVPRNDPEHAKYLRYYRAMGIPADFYWYTLHAAPADSMHWMQAPEVNRYAMTTQPAAQLGKARACENR